jgi:hypothetical protein
MNEKSVEQNPQNKAGTKALEEMRKMHLAPNNSLQLRIDPFNDLLLAPLGYCTSFTTTK